MEIRELHLKHFGKFTDQHFFIDEKLYIFYGENEYGKSTIYAFIKAMLFGLERRRGRAASNDEFSRYEPWENPNYYAGVMRFTSGGKSFRLERCFDRYSKSVSLICEDDGEELSVEDGDLEILLGGMTRESFENTAAIGQLLAKPGQELAEELKNYAANYYETGTGSVDLSGALETLRLRKKSVSQEIKELLDKQETKKDTVRQECQYVSNDAEKLRAELENNQEKLNHLQNTQTPPEETDSGETDSIRGESQWKSYITMGALGLVAGIAGRVWSLFTASQPVLSGGGAISVMSWLFLGIGVLLLAYGAIRYKSSRKEEKVSVWPQSDKEDELYRQELEWENQRIKAEWKEKQIRFQNLQEQLAEYDIPDEKIKSLRMTYQAIGLAEEKMLAASESMTQGFGNRLSRNASEILAQITGGRYTKLLVDEQLNMVLFEEGRRIPVERVSAGTIEQVYFALRMAVVDMLYEEPFPVIFDEAFAFYDEKRLKSTLKWLREQQRQVIIFTCQKRELEISEQLYPFRLKGRFT